MPDVNFNGAERHDVRYVCTYQVNVFTINHFTYYCGCNMSKKKIETKK